jgi:hypothetical protein
MGKPKVTTRLVEPKPASPLMKQMMAKVSPAESTRREGYPAPLSLLSNNSALGQAEFGLDLADAPVPNRRYAADLCSVRSVDGEMRIIFAQYWFDEADIQSALVIRMSRQAVKQFVESLESMGPDLGTSRMPVKIRDEALSKIETKPSEYGGQPLFHCSDRS